LSACCAHEPLARKPAPPCAGCASLVHQPARAGALEAAADEQASRAVHTPAAATAGGTGSPPLARVPLPAGAPPHGLGAGSALDAGVRAWIEPRFGHSFAQVRVHADGAAASAAAGLRARAFAVGGHVVFGRGQYQPQSTPGRQLIAHELAHLLQQHRGLAPAGAPQAKCDTDLGTASPACTPSTDGVVGWPLRFKMACDDLLPGEEAMIRKPKAGYHLKIHGYASRDGPPGFNEELSCHRANRVAELLRKHRADCPIVGIYQHGASPVSAPGVAPDANPPDFWRSVQIAQEAPPLASGEAWLDPNRGLMTARALLKRAAADPTQPNMMLVHAWREETKDWLTGVGKKLAPQGAKLKRTHMDDYRRIYAEAEQLWRDSDALLALHRHPDAAKDTWASWAIGPGKDQGDRLHAKGVPSGRYHVDIFGEGHFKGAINIGMAERTSTTGIQDSRVPNPIYRRFSSKDANALPIADGAADVVTAESGPIGFPGLASEIARIIAPGGTVVLYGPDAHEDAHDSIAQAVGGTVTKDRDAHRLQTTIIAP
jgi:Domain of unknown function (DUF4157)